MPDNILFEGQFNPGEIVKGIDAVIDKQRELLAQQNKVTETNTASAVSEEKLTTEIGKKSASIKKLTDDLESLDAKNRKVWGPAIETRIQKENEALQKLQASYEKVGVAATNLQKTVGKPLAVSLNSNQAVTQIQKLSASIETLRAKMLVKQELLIKETDLNKIRQYNKEIDVLAIEMKKIANAGKTGFDDFGNAVAKAEKSTNVLGKSFGFLRQAAYIIPGIGLAGIFNLIGEAAFSLGEEIFKDAAAFNEIVEKIKLFNDVNEDANKIAGSQINDLRILYAAATDVNLAMKDRLDAVKTLKTEFPEYFGQIDTEIILNGQAKTSYDLLYESIIKTSRAKAAKDKLDELEAKRLDIAYQRQKIVNATNTEYMNAKGYVDRDENGVAITNFSRKDVQDKILERRQKALEEQVNKPLNQLSAQEKFLIDFAGEANLAKIVEDQNKPGKTPKGKKAPEDVYREQLQKLKAKLASINESIFTSEDTIKAKVAEEVKKGNAEYDKLFREGKLTSPELASLKALNSTVGKAELAKEMKSFNEKRKAAQKQIDDELEKLRAEDVDKRIANIKGEFEQESAVIQMEYEKQKAALGKRFSDEADLIQKGVDAGTIKPEAQQAAMKQLMEAYDKLYTDLDAYVARKQAEQAQKSFEKSVQSIKEVFAGTFTVLTEETTKKLDDISAKYIQRTISYKNYQKDVTKILREETKRRNELEKLQLQSQLDSVNNRLANPEKGDTPEFTKKLKSQQLALRDQIAALQRTSDANETAEEKARRDKQFEKVKAIIGLYQTLANSIAEAFQTANDAEARALDRSIAIQQRRVDSAQKIADRGNATYLKAESDRMNQLQVKQEANAKRQIAINAAVQASQILVGISGAIAQAVAATGPGAPFVIAGTVAAIVGSLIAGYALVKSLQQNQPTFYEGTEDTGPGGRVDNKGGFHAILHPNERVVPADKNKELRGISNEQLVETVNQHKMLVEHLRTPSLPELNYDRLESAAHFHITHDGKLAALMEDLTYKQDESLAEMRRLNKNIRNISNSVNIDRNGIKVMLMAAVEDHQINKKV